MPSQEGIQRAAQEHKPKILFLTSPNNPDGSEISDEELEFCLNLPLLVVLDQAYIEFSEKSPITKLVETNTRQNLIVLRTFSKRAALAGLRVGSVSPLLAKLTDVQACLALSISSQSKL